MKIKRIIAYIIDLFLVSLVASIIVYIPIFNYDVESVQDKTLALYENILTSGSADVNESDYIESLYEIEKESASVNIIEAILIFLYFGVIGFIFNGQTLGKKIMKIKVVPNDGTKLNPYLYILRTILNTDCIVRIVSVISLYYLGASNWYSLYNIISSIPQVLIFASLGFMIFRDDERGLHDLICQTKVIETSNTKLEDLNK